MDFKDTLNLPQTDFPMRANLAKREPEMLEKWEKEKLYETIIEKRKNCPKYILHDGPPYANGHIHMGHALNKLIKDFIIKYKTMKGNYSYYTPGWDCHGLPIEHQVDKNLGKERFTKPISEKRQLCRKYAEKFIEIQKKEFKRLGVLGDWDNPYLTMNYEYEAKIARELGRFFENNAVYKRKKPVYWCASCITALAEAEVEYGDHTSPSIYVKFKVKDGKGKLDSENCSIVIWTTTPWTIPANLAIALHPDFDYSIVKTNGEKWVIASELIESCMKTFGTENYEIIKTYKGKDLENIICVHPFIERESLVILGNHVTLESGTGCVHTAPGHGQEDYEIALQYGIDILTPVDDNGKFTKEVLVDDLEGMFVFNANKKVIDILKEKNALIKEEDITHSYPHCWRCKSPIIFRATSQWFISMDKNNLREKALNAINNEVKWIPEWGKERIYNMISGRPDWCISRQRSWGVPITVAYCKNCNEIIATKELFKKVFEIFSKEGADAWFKRDIKDFLPENFKCPKCGSEKFSKEKDILDVWFDSGSSFAAVCEDNKLLKFPPDMYLEGSDQHRGWFHSSLLISVANRGIPPYKEVLTHGFVVDGDGKKMAKSAGNVIAPEEIIKQYGAEILRLWVAAQDYRDDIRISKEILKRVTESYRRIRNTLRYLLGCLNDFNEEKDSVEYNNMTDIDKWILLKLNRLVKRVEKAYDNFEFHVVYHAVHNFCVVDLSNFYLDALKDRMYVELKDSKERRSAQTAMHKIISAVIRLIAPVLSFTADEAWRFFKGENNSVHIEKFPETNDSYENTEIEEKYDRLIALKELASRALEDARKEKIIGHSLDAKVKVTFNNKDDFEFFKNNSEEFAMILIISSLEILFDENEGNTCIKVERASGEKCQRCWKYDNHVSEDKDRVCERCRKILNEIKK
jgi:isoleucyl-tRNA synthetase